MTEDVGISRKTVRDVPARFTGNELLYSANLHELTAMVEDLKVPGLLVTAAPHCQLIMVQHQSSGSKELGDTLEEKVSEDWEASD